MNELRVPQSDNDIEDEDVGCSWEELVLKQQRGDFGEIEKESLQEGDTYAMLDGPWRAPTQSRMRALTALSARTGRGIIFAIELTIFALPTFALTTSVLTTSAASSVAAPPSLITAPAPPRHCTTKYLTQ